MVLVLVLCVSLQKNDVLHCLKLFVQVKDNNNNNRKKYKRKYNLYGKFLN